MKHINRYIAVFEFAYVAICPVFSWLPNLSKTGSFFLMLVAILFELFDIAETIEAHGNE